MPKRYHSSVGSRVRKLEKHEEMEHGMSMGKLGSSFYDSRDDRRRQEVEDGNMIHEDHMAMANMPQNVIIREYPKSYGATYPELNDVISGIDEQNKNSASKTKHERFPSKY